MEGLLAGAVVNNRPSETTVVQSDETLNFKYCIFLPTIQLKRATPTMSKHVVRFLDSCYPFP